MNETYAILGANDAFPPLKLMLTLKCAPTMHMPPTDKARMVDLSAERALL